MVLHIAFEVVVAPLAAMVVEPPNDPLPSHNMSHMFSPRVVHMHGDIYLHA